MPAATELPEQAPSVAREAGTAVAAVVVVVATALAYGWSLGFHAENAHNGLLGGSFTAVGLYVVRMRAQHREGRLLLATGVLHAGMFFARQYGLDDGALPAASWVGWLGVWPLPLVIATAGWTFMAFPDGRLPSARWRAGVATMFAVASVLAVTSALWPVEYDRMRLAAPHPLDVPGAEVAARFWEYGQPSSYRAFQVLWTVAIVVRTRRARGESAAPDALARLCRRPGGPSAGRGSAVARQPCAGPARAPAGPCRRGLRDPQAPAVRHRPGPEPEPGRGGDAVAVGYLLKDRVSGEDASP